MQKEWTEDLANPKSQDYIELETNAEAGLKETFQNVTGVVSAKVIKFTKGSVVMHFR
jgi:hypothetical protein